MQAHSRRLQSNPKQQIERPLSEQERLDAVLALMVTRIGRSMTPERINQWHADLNDSPIEAIEWAFDCWSRNAKRLPALADITELLNTWQAKEQPTGQCDAECQEKHGTGYDLNDCLWLLKRVCLVGEKRDYVALFKELDAKRKGGIPQAFRGLPDDWMIEKMGVGYGE